MSTYIAKRLLLIVPTLLGAAALVFVIMRVIPGDVALLIFGGDAGGHIDPKQLAAMRHRLGLDQPLWVQFGTWLWGVLRFDFGTSLWTGRPVIEELLIRLPLSLELALAATAVSVIIAIPFGMLAAVRQDTWVDYVVRVVSIGGLAIPSFCGNPLHPDARDLLRLGTAARVHAALGRSLGELPDDGLAGDHRGLSVRRRDHAHDTLHSARGAAGRLHPHRLGERPAGAGRRHPACAEERDAPGDHADRDGVRVPDRRPGRDRDGVHAERRGAIRGRRRRPPGLPRRAGPDLSDRVRLRCRQPARRPDLRVVRSTDPIPLTMATNLDLAHATASAALSPRLTIAEEVAKFVRTKPLGAAGALIILGMMGLALFAELLAPYDPYHGDYGSQFARPSAEHWFGTDEFGRDVLSRIMYGARIA